MIFWTFDDFATDYLSKEGHNDITPDELILKYEFYKLSRKRHFGFMNDEDRKKYNELLEEEKKLKEQKMNNL